MESHRRGYRGVDEYSGREKRQGGSVRRPVGLPPEDLLCSGGPGDLVKPRRDWLRMEDASAETYCR